MKKIFAYLQYGLIVVVSLSLLQCTQPSSENVNDADLLVYMVNPNSIELDSLVWVSKETHQIINFDIPATKRPIIQANQTLIGFVEKDKKNIFIKSKMEKYNKSIDSADLEVLEYGFVPDEFFSPDLDITYENQLSKCAKSYADEAKKEYVVCIVQFTVAKKYYYSIVLHGEGIMDKEIWSKIINESLLDIKPRLEQIDH